MTISQNAPKFEFSPEQWNGIIIAGLVSSSISLVSSFFVVFIHGLLMCFRPYIVNRLSLRMILVACLFNIIFCVCQLVTDHIPCASYSCRIFAFVLIASDTMSCMCLAMVGLNLVLIFVFKVPKSKIIEASFYLVIFASGIVVTVVPAKVGQNRGSTVRNAMATCWYHYYFDGRINYIFNWMWYYGWLMFSLVFAALCAAISIRFIVKKQKNFSGALNMFSRSKKDIYTMSVIRKYADNNIDVFQKIARRCVCYPLVPLISKSWGVGIEIAAATRSHIPYAVFVLDRIFACLFGFMVGCIYFTDPAINACFKEFMDNIKTRYVHDYVSLKYKPAMDDSLKKASQYPSLIEVTSVVEENTGFFPTLEPLSQEYLKSNTQNRHDVPTMRLQYNKNQEQTKQYSIKQVTSIDGSTFSPNTTFPEQKQARNCCSLKNDNIIIIPLRRVHLTLQDIHQQHMRSDSQVQKLVSFKYPAIAKSIHWILVCIFKVKKVDDIKEEMIMYDQNEPSRIFRDFTDGSDVEITDLKTYHDNNQLISQDVILTAAVNISKDNIENNLNTNVLQNTSNSNIESSSFSFLDIRDHIPVRRAISINVGTLLHQKSKEDFFSVQNSPSLESNHSRPASTSIIKNSKIVSKLVRRPLSVYLKKQPSKINSINDSSLSTMSSISSKQVSITKSIKDVNELDLSTYPNELSPRPRSQYTEQSITKKLEETHKHDSISSSTYPLNDSESIENSMHLNELFQDIAPIYTDIEDSKLDTGNTSNSIFSDQELYNIMYTLNYQDGFIHGSTTVNNISNWSSSINDDERRICGISEPWDLHEQLKQQMNFAENSAHI